MTSPGGKRVAPQLKPPVEAVRFPLRPNRTSFFKLWLDPSMTYSCGYWEERPNMTLEEAQYAKRKLRARQAEPRARHDAARHRQRAGASDDAATRCRSTTSDVIGLTLSENQYAHSVAEFEKDGQPPP